MRMAVSTGLVVGSDWRPIDFDSDKGSKNTCFTGLEGCVAPWDVDSQGKEDVCNMPSDLSTCCGSDIFGIDSPTGQQWSIF